ncbi:hypothetical protein CIRG_00343 [Coccidioides immitis RMSCC 2394]|uniref:Uncharacterized protein n=1 Tax=Coccidioides immitis RMSCC 2394 TaxID=404692 RepID=A0A0J6XVJ3_COCIT|nr:hypothetical protein CIRG_00343 [Coccidioides immitis RMSCC 2394]
MVNPGENPPPGQVPFFYGQPTSERLFFIRLLEDTTRRIEAPSQPGEPAIQHGKSEPEAIGNPGQQEAPPPPLVELSPDQPVLPTGALGPQQTGAIATGIIPMGTAAIAPSATVTGQAASGDPLTFHFPALKAAH